MNVYLLTQEVDPRASILGFFWNWIAELSKRVENLYVSAYNVNEAEGLPENVHCSHFSYVLLPKTWLQITYLKLFKRLDVVFVHMCPLFLISVAPICKLLGIPVFLWYTHKHVDFKLKVACKLAKKVFTAHEKGCAVAGKKLVIMGYGIYVPPATISKRNHLLISVGRVSRVKEHEIAIRALPLMKKLFKDISLEVVGDIYDKEYYAELVSLVRELGVWENVRFLDKVSFEKMGEIYGNATLSIVTSREGISKASLESMYCGVPTLVRVEEFREVLGPYFEACRYTDSEELAEKVIRLFGSADLKEKIGEYAKNNVRERFGIEGFMKRLVEEFEK